MLFVYDFSCQNPNANIHTNCRFYSQPPIKGDNYFRCPRFLSDTCAPPTNDGQQQAQCIIEFAGQQPRKLLFAIRTPVHVPDTLYRCDSVIAEFASQSADVNVERPFADDDVISPNRSVNFVAGKYAVGLRVQKLQNFELLARQNLLALRRYDCMACFVDLYADDFCRRLLVEPFHYGIHATAQHAHTHRLGDVVVGTRLVTADLILLLVYGRQEYDHGIFQQRMSANGLARLPAVHNGHHRVEQNQMRMHPLGHFESNGTILGGIDLVTLSRKVVAYKF